MPTVYFETDEDVRRIQAFLDRAKKKDRSRNKSSRTKGMGPEDDPRGAPSFIYLPKTEGASIPALTPRSGATLYDWPDDGDVPGVLECFPYIVEGADLSNVGTANTGELTPDGDPTTEPGINVYNISPNPVPYDWGIAVRTRQGLFVAANSPGGDYFRRGRLNEDLVAATNARTTPSQASMRVYESRGNGKFLDAGYDITVTCRYTEIETVPADTYIGVMHIPNLGMVDGVAGKEWWPVFGDCGESVWGDESGTGTPQPIIA